MQRYISAAIAVIAVMALPLTAHADGNAARGKIVFRQCHACHSLKPGDNGVGPTLHGLFGRKAASVPGFRYSPFMRRSGIVWSPAALRKYLPNPQAMVPGTKMTFLGLKDPREIEDLIAYLTQATK